jgi:hypothetical protein
MTRQLARAVAAVLLLAVASGCQDLPGRPDANQPPETEVIPFPPVRAGDRYELVLSLSGRDVDGVVDHWEYAWESPEEWADVTAAELRFAYADDGHRHGVWVRAVDDAGAVDGTPVFVGVDADRLLPRTQITFGPYDGGHWGTRVVFRWQDIGGFAPPTDGYRYALVSLDDYLADGGDMNDSTTRILAWLDTLTYYPDFPGGYDTDSLVWQATAVDTVVFPHVAPTYVLIFGVRGVNHGGLEGLDRGSNARFFGVTDTLDGPVISLESNIAGNWRTGQPLSVRDVFRAGLRFRWNAAPGLSGAPVTGTSYAVDDSASWSPMSSVAQWPPGDDLWLPEAGPHAFFVKAYDAAGFDRTLAAQLMVYAGPRECAAPYVLVVLDTDASTLAYGSIWPPQEVFVVTERCLVQYWLAGHSHQVFETDAGTVRPPSALLSCASSVLWFCSTDSRSARSVLRKYHDEPPNPLSSYVASGGNLFLCGVSPANATRYFENTCTGEVHLMPSVPIDFEATLADSCLADHWMATQFGIGRILENIGDTNEGPAALKRLRRCTSRVTSGTNPYPDLPFDPLTWPNGPVYRGFGFYDRGIEPIEGAPSPAEVIYTADDSNEAIAIRRLTSPGIHGNVIYLGFHPYFVERPAFRDLLRAVLADFGEAPGS